jgi:putative phosphoesterase
MFGAAPRQLSDGDHDMKLGVLSDTHGQSGTVEAALAEFRARGVELVIHCGDIDDAETVRAFAGWNTHFVFGNCDWDREGIRRVVAEIGAVLHEPFGHLELAGAQVAWLHGDKADLKHDVEVSGHYDYLFYGHTHVAEQHLAGRTLVVNPGALFRARPRTCLVLDLPGGAMETVTIPGR